MIEAVESTGHTMNTLELLEKEDKVAIVKYLDEKGYMLSSANSIKSFKETSRQSACQACSGLVI